MSKRKRAAVTGLINFIPALAFVTKDPVTLSIIAGFALTIVPLVEAFYVLYPEESKEFHEQIRRVKKEIVKSPEFLQALRNTYDTLLNTKEEEKRKIIMNAFNGAYISQEEYAKDNLERLQNTAHRISVPALQHLSFIKREILPRKKKEVEALTKKATPQAGFTNEEFKAFKKRTITISQFYDEWYQEQKRNAEKQFNRNKTEETKKKFDMAGAREQKWRQQFLEFWTEYNTLGILRQGNDPSIGTYGGGSGTVQYLTNFGERFLNYLVGVSKET